MRDKPCCAAEAMRRIHQLNVGGVVIGLSMLDEVFDKIQKMDLSDRKSISNELIREVKIYNYVPRSAEEAYASALLEEYTDEVNKNGKY